MKNSKPQLIYRSTIQMTASMLDQNGHVNNVNYVQWMQDIAMQHYAHLGGIPPTLEIGATWYVRSHKIEYLLPAFLGDEIEVSTWVANLRRVRSLRKYEFARKSDGKLLVRGETDWVFVDSQTGKPLAIPEAISRLFRMILD